MRLALRDVFAGVSVAGLMLPEGVAYAGIAGLAPGWALASGIAGGLAYALAGRSRSAIVSPTSSSATILAASVGALAGGAHGDPVIRAALVTTLVAMVGLIFLGLALVRLGNLASFISRPVLAGFAFGLGITIISKQLPRLVGVEAASGPIWTVLGALVSAVGQWNGPSMALGLGALVALIALRRVPQVPGALIVIAVGIGLASVVDAPRLGIALAGPVSLAVPHFAFAPLVLLPRIAQFAAPIALILFAESWGTIRTLGLKHGETADASRELGALGLANIAAALAQGMPAGAGFSVGSANEAAGATNRAAAAIASLALAALALFAAPLIARIPEPVLAAVVIAALTHAVRPAPLVRLFRLDRDQGIALAAAAGVLGLGVLNGMLVAIALSITHLLASLAHPAISALGQVADGHDFVDRATHPDARPVAGAAIYRINAPLFFANAEPSLAAVLARAGNAQTVILSLEESNDLDATAADALGEFAATLAKQGRRLILARLHDAARGVLARAGQEALATAATFSVADAVGAASVGNLAAAPPAAGQQ